MASGTGQTRTQSLGPRPLAGLYTDPKLVWTRYCGFLDLSLPDFQDIQAQLLAEQIELMQTSSLGRRLLHGTAPRTIAEFRQNIPLTTYSDYAPYLAPGKEEALVETSVQWVHTTGTQADFKYIPYTQRAIDRTLDNLMGALILAAASQKGEVKVWPGDAVLHNTPQRPHLSGLVAFGMVERFGFTCVLDPATSEGLEFKERIQRGFQEALGKKVDVIISMTSVLAKVGEAFTERSHNLKPNSRVASPLAVYRISKAFLFSKLLRRPILPRDLWPVKAVIGWGIDAPLFRDQVHTYWGHFPFEIYTCTEGGVMGMQTWGKNAMVLSPYADFFEFIPEEAARRSRSDDRQRPQTVLLDEVKPGKTYEIVISNFYGMPLLRYRVGHFVQFADEKTEGGLPMFTFVGRADDRIDIAGFTRLDEKTVWDALTLSGLAHQDWTMRKEQGDGLPLLHLYIETQGDISSSEMEHTLHQCLRKVDPFYSDLEDMLGIRPLRVTKLRPGTFDRFYSTRKAKGVESGSAKPPHMNAEDDAIRDLLQASEG